MKQEVKVSNEQIEEAVELYLSSRDDSNNKVPEDSQESTGQIKPETRQAVTGPSQLLGRGAVEFSKLPSGEISKLLE